METKMVTIDLSEVDIHIKCGDTFVEWTGEQFVKHMKWVEEDIHCDRELKALRERLQSTYDEWSHCRVCNHISEYDGKPHEEGCWLKAELDKLKGDE